MNSNPNNVKETKGQLSAFKEQKQVECKKGTIDEEKSSGRRYKNALDSPERKLQILEVTKQQKNIHSELRQTKFKSIMAEQQSDQQQQRQANELTTLRQVLTQERPLVLSTMRETIPKPCRANMSWEKIQLWSQFTLEGINGNDHQVLDQPLTGLTDAIPNSFNVLDNLRLDCQEDMFSVSCWIGDILAFSVPYTVSRWNLKVPGTLHFQVNEFKAAPFGDCFYSGIETSEGWTGLIVGTHQPKSTWNIDNIRDSRGSTAGMDMALSTLAFACEQYDVNLGYILTLNELVVCEFDPYSGGALFKVMPIPLLDTGERKMTAELAVWVLCMLALEEATSESDELADSEYASNSMSDGAN